VNSLGEGKLSDNLTVFIELGGLPSEPRSLVLDLLDEGVELSWFEPLETGEGSIEGYRIYRKIQNRTDFTVIDEIGPTNEYLDEDIEPNRTYVYKVSAYNSVGEGPSSSERKIFIADNYNPIPGNHTDGDTEFPWWIFVIIVPLMIIMVIIFILLLARRKKSEENHTEQDIDREKESSLEEEILGAPPPVQEPVNSRGPRYPMEE
ncbi:MAG: fibronectin type III domain-containing protein, partial [Thermoplasmatota archaeon]